MSVEQESSHVMSLIHSLKRIREVHFTSYFIWCVVLIFILKMVYEKKETSFLQLKYTRCREMLTKKDFLLKIF